MNIETKKICVRDRIEGGMLIGFFQELCDISSDDEVSDDHYFGFSDDNVDGEMYLSVEQNTTHPKVENFMEVVDRYDVVDFRAHFRLKRSTVNLLIGMHFVVNCDKVIILCSCR